MSNATVIDSLTDLEPGDTVFVDAPEPDFGEPLFPKGTVGQTTTTDYGTDAYRNHVDVDLHGTTNNYDLIEDQDGEIRVPDVGTVTVIRYRGVADE